VHRGIDVSLGHGKINPDAVNAALAHIGDELVPVTEDESAEKLYEDILRLVFNADGQGRLHAVNLKGSGSEIGLRIGDAGEYFGVINVGEPKKLWDKLQESHGELITCSEQQFSVSLFDDIKEPGSKIRLLVGAKKFTEGWSCWRVSCMGLVNIGRNEGSQIIQLFGRGVRLKGLDFGLKRSRELPENDHPRHIEEMETLNIFGIRADYMKVFNEYIDEEDVISAKKIEIINLPTIENLARTDLKVILPKRDMPEFKKEQKPVFGRYDKIKTKISADWYGRLDSKTSRYRLYAEGEERLNCTHLKPVTRMDCYMREASVTARFCFPSGSRRLKQSDCRMTVSRSMRSFYRQRHSTKSSIGTRTRIDVDSTITISCLCTMTVTHTCLTCLKRFRQALRRESSANQCCNQRSP